MTKPVYRYIQLNSIKDAFSETWPLTATLQEACRATCSKHDPINAPVLQSRAFLNQSRRFRLGVREFPKGAPNIAKRSNDSVEISQLGLPFCPGRSPTTTRGSLN
ncbi:hypothetical protein HN011_007379 [Eciton burchellii]|nr:hypothetical protein HN011_007379 [Eciton burchellii]